MNVKDVQVFSKMKLLLSLREKKNVILKKENIIYLFTILIIFLFDRYSKTQVINKLEKTYYFNDYLNLDLVWNTGIGFGLLSQSSILLYNLISIIIGLVIIFLIYYVFLKKIREKFIFSIIIGGAIGNFYDRMVFKAVPDFIDLHFKDFHWFTFNVADVFITLGIAMYIIVGVAEKK